MSKPTDPNKHKYMFSDDMKFLQKILVFHPTIPNKFLTIRRASFHRYHANLWEFPGGNVLYGQSHLDSLLSEIREESHLDVSDITPVEVQTKMFDGYYFLFILYKGVASSDKVTLSDEHTEYKWVTKDEFLRLPASEEYLSFVRKYA